MDTIKLPRYLVEDALSHAGVWDFSIREDYSGRFMYGKTCLGVVLDASYRDRFLDSLRDMVAGEADYEGVDDDELEDDELDELEANREKAELIRLKAANDSMGLQMIVYFPGVTLED